MKNEIIEFYSSLRQIFTVCPCCDQIHRLSDCKIYRKERPAVDWKEKIDSEIERLEKMEIRLKEKIEAARINARIEGRKSADTLVKKIDPVFSPLKLNPNDAKVLFHPIDFLVFKGMNDNLKNTGIKEIILLDNSNRKGQQRIIQNSIEKVIQNENYEWLTMRVGNDGKVFEED